MNIKRFEDLEIRQIARELYKYVFKLTSENPFCKDIRFRDQMRASAGSMMDNIPEGFERGGNKEFYQFLSIAKGSCGELRSQSYRAFDSEYILEEQLNYLLEKTELFSRKTTRLMSYIKSSPLRGSKYN